MSEGQAIQETGVPKIDAFIQMYRLAREKLFSLPLPASEEEIEQLEQILSEPFFGKGSPRRQDVNERHWYSVLHSIQERSKALHEIIGKSDLDVFQRCFGFQPSGKMEVIRTPISVYFKLHNPSDYIQASVKSAEDRFIPGQPQRILSAEEKKVHAQTGGMMLHRTPDAGKTEFRTTWDFVAIENTSNANPQKTFIHENQHILFRILNRNLGHQDEFMRLNRLADKLLPQSLHSQQDIETLPEKARGYLFELKQYIFLRAQDELLAYYVGGRPWEKIEKTLTTPKDQSGLYDYIGDYFASPDYLETRKTYNSYRPSEQFESLALEALDRSRYNSKIHEAISIFTKFSDQLKARGCSGEEIAVIASFYPMSAWSKYFGALLSE